MVSSKTTYFLVDISIACVRVISICDLPTKNEHIAHEDGGLDIVVRLISTFSRDCVSVPRINHIVAVAARA